MKQPDRILIYRLGSLGDTVVALPCFHLLARMYPNSNRVLLTNAPVHAKAAAASSVLVESGLIHEYITYAVGTRGFIELARLWWKLWSRQFNTVVYLHPSRGEAALRRDELFFRLCGISEIIGLPHGELGTHYYDALTDRYEAEASRLARCIVQIGDARPREPASWDLLLTEKERAHAMRALRPLDGSSFLVIGMASKQQVKDWGIANWKELMPRLHREFSEHALVFVGAKEDISSAAEVASEWTAESLNLCGELSPRESAALIQQADLFIGVDSGPMHLAAAVGTPCVSLFAANRVPGMWFPSGESHEIIYHKTSCFGCNLDTCTVEKKKCILSISVDEVLAATVKVKERNKDRAKGLGLVGSRHSNGHR